MESDDNKAHYEPPEIISYSTEELLDEIAFAQGCSPSPCPTP
jgi:hypothetical protein